MPTNETTESCDRCKFNFVRYCQTVSESGYAIPTSSVSSSVFTLPHQHLE